MSSSPSPPSIPSEFSDDDSDGDVQPSTMQPPSGSILDLLEQAEKSHELTRKTMNDSSVGDDNDKQDDLSLPPSPSPPPPQLDLTASVDDLVTMLSPSFSQFDFSELFADDVSPRSSPSSSSWKKTNNAVDDSIHDEIDNLEAVEEKIRRELEEATRENISFDTSYLGHEVSEQGVSVSTTKG